MKNLTKDERQVAYELLLDERNNGQPTHGSMAAIAAMLGKSQRTIRRIWSQARKSISNEAIDVSSKRVGRVGRKKKHIDLNQIATIPFRKRTNICSLLATMNVAKSKVHRRIKVGELKATSNAIKPELTDSYKKARLRFFLSRIIEDTPYNELTFVNMFHHVHIDEKWFYMTKTTERYYLLPDEIEPLRTCKSKNFIPKVMFLAPVARPRFDENGEEIFSGKIGIFPFVFQEAAKRVSKNRSAGTLETKFISSITKDVYRSCLIEKVSLAIQEKRSASCIPEPIFMQQDNAKPHIAANDPEFLEAAKRDGFDIHLEFQPPNSPDMNVLDLGFFRAIQSLQHLKAPSTIDELVADVEKSFNQLSAKCLNRVFLTLQECMIEVMKVHGGNYYKLLHMNKNRLKMEGNLPISLQFDNNILEEAKRHLGL